MDTSYLTADILNGLESSINGNDAMSCVSSCFTSEFISDVRDAKEKKYHQEDDTIRFSECQEMERNCFFRWLNTNNLSQYQVYFEEDGYVLGQGEYPNELEVFNATEQDLIGFLTLEKSLLLCFFDREIFITTFLSTYAIFMSPETLFNQLVDKYDNCTSSLSFNSEMSDSVLEVIKLFIQQDYLFFSDSLQLDIYHFLCITNMSLNSLLNDSNRMVTNRSPKLSETTVYWDEKDILLISPNEYSSFLFGDDFSQYLEELNSRNEDEPFLPLLIYPILKVDLTNHHMETKVNGKVNFQKMKNIYLILETGGLLDVNKGYNFELDLGVSKYLENAEIWMKEARLTIARELKCTDKPYTLLDSNKLWNKHLDESIWEILYSEASVLMYDPGDVIISEKCDMRRLYQIKSGRVIIMKGNTVVRTLEQDTFIGIESYLNFGSRHRSAYNYVANTSVGLLKFRPEDIFKICQKSPEFSRTFNSCIANQILSPYYVPAKPRKNFQPGTLQDLGVKEVVIFETNCQLKKNNTRINGKIRCSFNYFAFVSKESKNRKRTTILKLLRDASDIYMLNGKSVLMIFGEELICFKSKKLRGTFDTLKFLAKKSQYCEDSSSEGNLTPKLMRKSFSDPTVKSKYELSISQNEWKFIVNSSKQISFVPGEIISEKGSQGRSMFYVLSGRCSVIGEDKTMVAHFNSGQIYGKMSFLFGEPSNFTFKAKTEVSVLVIEPYLLNFMFENESSFGGRFYYFLAKEISKHKQVDLS
eukprot:TRINITY_DN2654_c1_g1_i5.p1 TRINITY_DN2654_c1_g1~~TRINITY_DN2654_c1_g1_i5.p1  ORF type:complete len:757 (+),score=120.89 TRINITY_DN2654_c1_g1_i5:481-2751(+)